MYDVNEMKEDVKMEKPENCDTQQKREYAAKVRKKNTQHVSDDHCEIDE